MTSLFIFVLAEAEADLGPAVAAEAAVDHSLHGLVAAAGAEAGVRVAARVGQGQGQTESQGQSLGQNHQLNRTTRRMIRHFADTHTIVFI